jgi:radical SAM superfamily enzyme YgiQ (UPF0313 family)
LEIAKRPDVLKKMYKAGFMAFLLGVESAHDKTLKSMKKGFNTANKASNGQSRPSSMQHI